MPNIPAHIAAWAIERDRGGQEEVHVDGSIYEYEGSFDDDKYDEIVMDLKGGAPAPPPAPYVPTPQEQASARIAEDNARAERERAAEERAAREAEAQRQRDIQATQQRVAGAYNSAIQTGQSNIEALGLADNDFGLMDLYRSKLDQARSSIPEITTDPGQYFTPTLFDDAKSTITSTRRRDLGNELDNFAYDGFARDRFQDTADDAIIDSVLAEKRAEADRLINAARLRGQINDTGFDYATGELGRAATIGRSKLDDAGLGILEGFRGQLRDEAGIYRNKIDNYALGDKVDLGRAQTNIGDLGARLDSRLEGDILGAITPIQVFDTNTILSTAGDRGGIANNLSSSPVAKTGTGVQFSTTGSNPDEQAKRTVDSGLTVF